MLHRLKHKSIDAIHHPIYRYTALRKRTFYIQYARVFVTTIGRADYYFGVIVLFSRVLSIATIVIIISYNVVQPYCYWSDFRGGNCV